jgi:putative DNA primase/helicase
MNDIRNIVKLAELQNSELPQIEIAGGHLLQILAAAENAMLAIHDQPVYQRGGSLVRLLRLPKAETLQGIKRPAGALVITDVTPEWLRCQMARTARFVKYDGRHKKIAPVDPPIRYATALASISGDWRFPSLLATIEAPTLRADGTILQTPGYDRASGLYFDATETFPVINETPTIEDAQRAVQQVGKLLRDFPFVDGAATSVALAAIMTSLVRRALPTAPMTLFDAPTRASGKTLLARLVATIAIGREPTTMTYTADSDEERKRIMSVLASGDPIVCVDNISRPLEGDTLCSVLTTTEMHDRKLGSNEILRVPTCTTWLGTGNNLTVRGDMTTRVIACRIDPGVEHPEEREFDYDLLADARQKRGEIVAAALTVLRAYIVAGRPRQPIKQFGRFEAWSDLIRAALVWVGCTDLCATRERIEQDDPITENVGAVLLALSEQFPDGKGFTVRDVVEAIRPHHDMFGTGTEQVSALRTALENALPRREIHAAGLGYWFRRHKDRMVGGIRLRSLQVVSHTTTWCIDVCV